MSSLVGILLGTNFYDLMRCDNIVSTDYIKQSVLAQAENHYALVKTNALFARS